MLFRSNLLVFFGLFILTAFPLAVSGARADFFINNSHLIDDNGPRLSYGVAVADLNGNNTPEFVVTGFGYPNLALEISDGRLSNRLSNSLFSDAQRKTIGVAACDVDGDGMEEVYFLNTDAYSGEKVLADRLLGLAPRSVAFIYMNVSCVKSEPRLEPSSYWIKKS